MTSEPQSRIWTVLRNSTILQDLTWYYSISLYLSLSVSLSVQLSGLSFLYFHLTIPSLWCLICKLISLFWYRSKSFIILSVVHSLTSLAGSPLPRFHSGILLSWFPLQFSLSLGDDWLQLVMCG